MLSKCSCMHEGYVNQQLRNNVIICAGGGTLLKHILIFVTTGSIIEESSYLNE